MLNILVLLYSLAAPPVSDFIEDVLKSPPAPTKEQLKLVELMGDDEWRVREKANKELKDMGYKAIAALEKGLKSDDLEIRVRCRRTLSSYFGVYSDDKDKPIPNIWFMPEKYRFTKDGRDLAKEYYVKHRDKYNKENRDNVTVSEADWSNEQIIYNAMIDYKEKLLRHGITREKMKTILNDTAKRSTTHYLDTEPGHWNQDKQMWYNGVPKKAIKIGQNPVGAAPNMPGAGPFPPGPAGAAARAAAAVAGAAGRIFPAPPPGVPPMMPPAK